MEIYKANDEIKKFKTIFLNGMKNWEKFKHIGNFF